MSRKNNKAKYDRMHAYYALDEKIRAEKLARRNASRKANAEQRAKAAAANKDSHKKPKKKPIVANADKNTRKMAKMMKKMSLDKKRQTVGDSSESSDAEEDNQWEDMETDAKMELVNAPTKSI